MPETSDSWRAVDLPDELREHPRFQVAGYADIYGVHEWVGQSIVNLSVGGICLDVPEPASVGQRLKIDLGEYCGVGPVPLEGEVIWASGGRMGLRWTCGPKNPYVRDYLLAARIAVVSDSRDG